jgi:hypothetical protein
VKGWTTIETFSDIPTFQWRDYYCAAGASDF